MFTSEHVRTFFAITQSQDSLRTISDGTHSQQSKADACANELYVAVAMCFKILFLKYSFYLRSLKIEKIKTNKT